MAMAPRHDRHRPPRINHDRMGTLSYHAMGVSQEGQADLGLTMDIRLGTR